MFICSTRVICAFLLLPSCSTFDPPCLEGMFSVEVNSHQCSLILGSVFLKILLPSTYGSSGKYYFLYFTPCSLCILYILLKTFQHSPNIMSVNPFQRKSDHVPSILRFLQGVCISYWIKSKHFGTAVRCLLLSVIICPSPISSEFQQYQAVHCFPLISYHFMLPFLCSLDPLLWTPFLPLPIW